MKILLLAILTTLAAGAELVETTIEWRPACDGATIDVISDGTKIQSVRAFAAHSLNFREWTIHYVDGIAVTAEYRERERGKIKEGDRAGEDSGDNPIKRLVVFKAVEGKFKVADKDLADDLADVLSKAKPKSEQAGGGQPATRIKWLAEILASREKSVPLEDITFSKFFNNDPTVQGELLNAFRAQFPDILADAFKSAGNLHNPKVLLLRSKFSECLLKTATLIKINDALLSHGYSVKRIEFEKFLIDKEKKTTPFHAFIWLIIEPIENGEAQQAAPGQPAPPPGTKPESNQKPDPHSEGRSR